MSEQNEVELPNWEATEWQRTQAEAWWESIRKGLFGPKTGAINWFLCAHDREHRLRAALSQIAALTKQVEELTRANGRLLESNSVASHEGWQAAHDKRPCGHPRAFWQDANYPMSEECYNPDTGACDPPMIYRCILCAMGAELALCRTAHANLTAEHDLSLAELAALREGATVTYRVEDYRGSEWMLWVRRNTEAEARSFVNDTRDACGVPVRICEIVTRERILDEKGEG